MTARRGRCQATYAELRGSPRSAAEARELVFQILGENHPSVDDAALVVSELVGNAIAHTRSGQSGGTLAVAIDATAQPDSVFIRVRDAGSLDVPRPRSADADDEHGRGLLIVGALAAEWGTNRNRSGRVTCCRLTPGHQAANVPERDEPHAGHVPEREAG